MASGKCARCGDTFSERDLVTDVRVVTRMVAPAQSTTGRWNAVTDRSVTDELAHLDCDEIRRG